MKIALLHLDLSAGPLDKNIIQLQEAIRIAAINGAKWVVTPEMAVQGYFFTQMKRPFDLNINIENTIKPIIKLAQEFGIYIFLGCGEFDEIDGNNYNSCLVIDDSGNIIARHRKMKVVKSKSEAWATPGNKYTLVNCNNFKVGVLVCADAWFSENALELKKREAEIIIVIAAWPPGCGGPPEEAWKRCSNASGNKPVFVCNQTGYNNGMNCLIAKSAVILEGELEFAHKGNPAVVVCEIENNQELSLKQCAVFNI